MRPAGLLLVLMVGCNDFDLVAPTPSQPSLAVSISVSSADTTNYSIYAEISVGRDDAGHPRALLDSVFTVNGDILRPDSTSSASRLRFRWQRSTLASVTPDTLVFGFPALGAVSGARDTTYLVIPVRQDPANISVANGQDLRLHVAHPVASEGLVALNPRWSLRVGQQCTGEGLDIQGSGEHPFELHVPWDWFGTGAPASLKACFQHFSHYEPSPPSALRSFSLSFGTTWRIAVSP